MMAETVSANPALLCDVAIILCLLLALRDGMTKGLIWKVGTWVSAIAAYVLAGIFAAQTSAVAYGLVFFISYGVLRGIFQWVLCFFDLINRIPVVGLLNRIGGAILGLLSMGLILFILINILTSGYLIPQTTLDGWGMTREAMDHSYLLRWFRL